VYAVTGISLFVAQLAFPAVTAGSPVAVSEAKTDDNGFLVHEVRSPYQAGTTRIRVLRPDTLEAGKTYTVVYVLPVEAGTESRYGDGLKEVKKLGLHNALGAVFVAPTFYHLPWYADHPTRAGVRQESYFLRVVVPFIDRTYPVRAAADGRLLLGFSKSGWGAWSLLLRHPDRFGRAAAWDAPMMMDQPGKYGSGDVFGTANNFEGYHVGKLIRDKADQVRKGKRLILLGYGNFRAEHDWHSGWVGEAVDLLLAGR
jgi:S-formylglutathione hydrolase FrmB